MLFPGQGIQFPKMGIYFYNNYAVAKRTFSEASHILGWSVDKLCFEGTVGELNRFSNMQILIFTTEMAMYRSFQQDYGTKPTLVMGHSIGEYTALVCAGAIDFADALHLLIKRGELIEGLLAKQSERMAIIENIRTNQLQCLLEGMEKAVLISCYNSSSQHAVCGDESQLIQLAKALKSVGARMTPLLFSPPMHTKFMLSAQEEYQEYLRHFSFSSFAHPVISNVKGKPFLNGEDLVQMLADHLTQPVQWANSIDCLIRSDITCAVEISPRTLLSPFLNENQPGIRTLCYGLNKDRDILARMFSSGTASMQN
ncbi:hypothetical protein PMSD_25220 [Paenibacillus macquariensis subsp. defensor]|nr:hypothetical protein PMSD_25220 [Paenibacillus macquariensis subsp. defensor]